MPFITKEEKEGWKIVIHPAWIEQLEPFSQFWQIIMQTKMGQSISDRSLTATIQYQQADLFIKNPLKSDQSVWQRLISPLRKSEVHRSFLGSVNLFAENFPVPSPVMYCEKRKLGFLLESRFVCQHISDIRCHDQAPLEMLHLLERLHALNFIHSDPHINNFLYSNNQAYLIDLANVVRTSNRLLKALDFARLEKSDPDIFQAYTPALPHCYRILAKFLVRTGVIYRLNKRRLRFFFAGNKKNY